MSNPSETGGASTPAIYASELRPEGKGFHHEGHYGHPHGGGAYGALLPLLAAAPYLLNPYYGVPPYYPPYCPYAPYSYYPTPAPAPYPPYYPVY